MVLCYSFPPVATPEAKILILGSMPGVASITAGQYYAHPRNLFWPIMGELFGAGPSLAYEERLTILAAARVGLWDVLESCIRPGSLDGAIRDAVPNDFGKFFEEHLGIDRIVFNGTKAQTAFRRYVTLKRDILQLRLPSTSPAHAAMPLDQKIQKWRDGLNPALPLS
jgi:TDG/mug DNA glycosylase family protein